MAGDGIGDVKAIPVSSQRCHSIAFVFTPFKANGLVLAYF
jgi:hypothetical protein